VLEELRLRGNSAKEILFLRKTKKDACPLGNLNAYFFLMYFQIEGQLAYNPAIRYLRVQMRNVALTVLRHSSSAP
jgi:hypothetical protein